MVGNSDQSWGWDIGRLKVLHNNVTQHQTSYYPGTVTHHHQWSVPDTFSMVLDMDQGNLGFVVGDQWLGWAVLPPRGGGQSASTQHSSISIDVQKISPFDVLLCLGFL